MIGYVIFFVTAVALLGNGGISFAASDEKQIIEQSNPEVDETAFDNAFQEIEERQDARWSQKEAEIEARWKAVEDKVAYHLTRVFDRGATRATTDFEKGRIDISTVAPNGSKVPPRERLANAFRETLKERDALGNPLYQGQIKTDAGAEVSTSNADSFIDSKLAAVQSKQVIADGKPITQYSISIDMVPEHKRVRLQKYLPLILKYANEQKLAPSFVTAIIDAESAFNPQAISRTNALGLMQLMPQYGARDAYEYLYGEAHVPSTGFLFDPENNIRLGTAYLRLLGDQEFGGIDDADKKRALIICSYNWGPRNLKEKALAEVDIGGISGEKLQSILLARTPAETRNYLVTVLRKEKEYNQLFPSQKLNENAPPKA